MTELSQILTKLETGAGFNSKNLESYRDLSEKPKLVELDHARQRFYEGYDAAILEGASHEEALRKSRSLELTYRASQAETTERWVKAHETTIHEGTQVIEDEGLQKTVQVVYPMLTEKLSSGHRRFRHDIAQVLLSVTDKQSQGESAKPLQDLHAETKEMVEKVADGKVFDSSALVGQTIEQATKSGAPLAPYLVDMSKDNDLKDTKIEAVESVGISQNRTINNGLQMLSEPPINAEVVLGK